MNFFPVRILYMFLRYLRCRIRLKTNELRYNVEFLILVETSGAISLVDVNEMFYLQSINSKCTDEERQIVVL